MELSKIKKVYMLYHETERNNDRKLIGFFSTREKADIEKEKYVKMKGFKDFPEGFKIKTLTIGKSYYTKGFKSKAIK
mgnify:CR=1 FL=1